ncbi:zinc-binding alcohol dehydrogenase family protein [Nesterenkonia flava]|uniref:Zinc-binding alcohol dehydrogenase family protein n=1 Tax=Nesterenkonia flava TaxID=469799 RepID=A0ABU1FW44_9MICC|nr:zinc-binding alcohol dehydrogenase family protein [Nesterenkonia flava]MDR5712911.1 zinc-binding alcohol dehydrogenase family protein [Nesterenkonia flava]
MADTPDAPSTMEALVVVDGDQGTPHFASQILPVPELGRHDLVVAVRAVSVNPVDTKVRIGAAPQPQPRVLGWDASGVVVRVGAEVSGFVPGDEVYYAGDLTRPGTNASHHVVDSRVAAHKPASLTVVATASRQESQNWCRELGADHVIDHRSSLAGQLQDIAPAGVDYAFSAFTDGQEHKIAEAMAPQSSLLVIDDPEGLPTSAFKPKSIALHWEFMFTRTMFQTPDMARQGEILAQVAQMLDAGTLVTTLGETLEGLTPETLARAHELLETSRTTGKVVIVR